MKYRPEKHNGILPPVVKNKMVVYRTQSPEGKKSHIHAPVRAEYLDWSGRPTLGRIVDYMVMK